MKTILRYQNKRWLTINQTTQTHSTHRHALIAALRHDQPDLAAAVHTIAQNCATPHGLPPTILDRLLNAAALVAKGHVYDGLVQSQTSANKYVTPRHTLSTWTCTCPDFQNGGLDLPGYGRHCKHTLAQLLCWLTATPIQYLTRREQHDHDAAHYLAAKNGTLAEYLREENHLTQGL